MFNLDRLEKYIIIFLIFSLLAGSVILLYNKTHPSSDIKIGTFTAGGRGISDVHAIDSVKRIRVNINEADAEEIARLDGIGKVIAERIVEYRAKEGPFRSADEIVKVKGIGKTVYEKIRDDISIE